MADSNAPILNPAHKHEEYADVPEVKVPKLSKSQLRKQKKVQEEHTKRQQRAQVTFPRQRTFAVPAARHRVQTHQCNRQS